MNWYAMTCIRILLLVADWLAHYSGDERFAKEVGHLKTHWYANAEYQAKCEKGNADAH